MANFTVVFWEFRKMRILMTLLLSLAFVVHAEADWTGAGTYSNPYVFTSPQQNNTYYIVKRGQTLYDDMNMVAGNQVFESHYQQVQSRQDYKIIVMGMGIMRWNDEGTFQDREYMAVNKMDTAGNWKKIYERFDDFSGVNVEFQSPMNPPEIVGEPKLVTVKSEIHQDVNGDVGDLDVTTMVENANPNPNNDPPADDWQFHFTFDLPNDGWTAFVFRQVNGNLDISGTDSGGWNPYGAGTNITLPNPSQPLSGQQSDWYLDGANADDAWTLLNNVHYHPGPITFSFAPYTEAYLTEHRP